MRLTSLFLKRSGFTLIEFIVYIGISAAVLIAAVFFSHMVLGDSIKYSQLSEVRYEGNFALNKIVYYTERADSINPLTQYNTQPGTLVITGDSENTTIDTYEKTIDVRNGTQSIRKLRLQQGSNPAIDLTSDKVHVTSFYLENLSHSSASVIKMYLTLEAINPSNSPYYGAESSWNTTVTLRRQ